ncbi:MAG: tRNA lysidine(34) synthetase TilS, partial [Pseudohongiellaceae bacterium]
MAFSESAVQSGLEKLNDNSNIWVAYSGGMDSHVLLHLMVRLLPSQERRLRALHINHGISPHAADWQSHCQQTCSDLGIPFQAVSVSLDADGTDSLETRARKARYRVFADRLGPGDYLFLAHHLDDQIETMLFRLLRGTGLKGLAGMPVSRPLGAGQLYRPLLALARDELEQYAIEHRLQWIEDDSNARADYDRNYLRLKVLPLLEKRWPGYKNNWLRTAQ